MALNALMHSYMITEDEKSELMQRKPFTERDFLIHLFPSSIKKTLIEREEREHALIRAAKVAKEPHPPTLVTKELVDEVHRGINGAEEGGESGRKMGEVKSLIPFVDKVMEEIIGPILRTKEYEDYLNGTVGSPDPRTIRDLYLNFCQNRASSGIDAFFSPDSLTEFLKFHLIEALIPAHRAHFSDKMKQYRESIETSYSDYMNHLGHFLTGNTGPFDPFGTGYMRTVLQEVTKPWNHTIGIDFSPVILTYRFEAPFDAHGPGFRRVIQTSSSQEEKLVYDFLEFYSSIEPSDRIKAVICKQADEVRIKRSHLDTRSTDPLQLIDHHAEFTAVHFFPLPFVSSSPTGGPANDHSNSSSRIEGGRALFDHYSSACILTGTSEEIREMTTLLNRIKGVNLGKIDQIKKDGINAGEFLSFEGKMKLRTRAMLLKPLLQNLFTIPFLSRYWYPKSATHATGNYVYVYTSEDITVPPIETNDYVSLRIEPERKQTMTVNSWILSFEGNKQSQVLPFLSMLIALLQMLENMIYDRRFILYKQAEKAYLDYFRRNKDTRTSLLSFATMKQEVYISLLKEAGLSNEQISRYGDHARPFAIDLPDTEGIKRWRTFYTSVITGINPLVGSREYQAHTIGSIREDRREFDLKVTEAFNDRFGSFEMTERGFRFANDLIGLIRGGKLFLTYPTDGNIYAMEERGEIPTRKPEYIKLNDTTSPNRGHSSSQRTRAISHPIRETVALFTNAQAEHMVFFLPQAVSQAPKDPEKRYDDFIKDIYKGESLRAILSQHLWDHDQEEMERTLTRMNVYLHQDMLQHLMGALIFCFVIDSETNEYRFQLPRHSRWYSQSTAYDRAIFLFQTRQGNYESVLFSGPRLNDNQPYTPISDKMRSFLRISLLGSGSSELSHQLDREREPITYLRLMTLIGTEVEVIGQLFNSDGKCTGFRLKRDSDVIDVRIDPQFPILPTISPHIGSSQMKRFAHTTDSMTNIEGERARIVFSRILSHPSGKFTLIPRRTTSVRFRVSSIYEETRSWKQRVYLFSRMVLTHWLLDRVDTRIESRGAIDWTKRIRDYVEHYIQPLIPGSESRIDELTRTIIPEIHENRTDFEAYLTRSYPGSFREGAFRVHPSELDRIRDYMIREIDLIRNYPPSFGAHFMNARVDTKLLPPTERSSSTQSELIGIDNIQRASQLAQIKERLLNNSYYLQASRFTGDMDPLSVTKKQVEKGPLILIEVVGRLCLLRLTRIGQFEVACFICHSWRKEKRIMHYEETRSMISTARRFEIKGRNIVEQKDNDQKAIEASDQDYWILGYTRFERVPNKKEPAERVAYCAILPL